MSPPAKRRRGRPPRALKGEASVREQLLRAAGECFGELGYAGTSVSMIVDRVGVSPAALYWHFDNKEGVLNALLTEGMQQFHADIDAEVGEAREPVDVVRRLVAGHVRAILGDARVARIAGFSAMQLSRSLTRDHYQAFNERQHQHLARWREVIRSGVSANVFDVEDPSVAACAIIDMCEGTRAWFHSEGPLSINELADQYGRLVLGLVGYRGDLAALDPLPAPADHHRGDRAGSAPDEGQLIDRSI